MTYGSSTASSGTYYGDYDELGRVKTSYQQTNALNYRCAYGYDLAGALISETYPSNRVVVMEYNTDGKLAGVKNPASGNYWAGGAPTDTLNRIQYTAHGAVSAMKLGATTPLWEHTNFNNRLQPIEIGLGTASSDASKLKLEYSYTTTNQTDNNGNVLTQKITAPQSAGGTLVLTQSYAYDQVNRLQSASETSSAGGGWSEQFSYDRYGNMWVSGSSGITLSPQTPTAQAAFNPATNRLAMANVVYDNAGNLKVDTQSRTFDYDAENRQIAFNSTAASYAYDGDGKRVQKSDATGTTVFVYNAMGQMVAEYRSDPVPPAQAGGGVSYLTADALGSTRVVTDANGAVKSRRDYLPFGEELPTSAPGVRGTIAGYGASDGQRERFTSKERDDESGLDYFIARYYSSSTGRFLSPDEFAGGPQELYDFADAASSNPTFYANPNNPQSLNKYQYCYNNPLNTIDPSGHQNPPSKLDKAIEIGQQAVADTINGGIKGLYNTYANTNNLLNDVLDYGISKTGSKFRFGHMPVAEADTPGESGAMLGVDISLLFLGAKGAAGGEIAATSATRTGSVVEAAADTANAARGGSSGAAGAFKTRSGNMFTATSGAAEHHPAVQNILDGIPVDKRSPFHGKCCEPKLVSNALRAGENPTGGTMSIVRIRNNLQHGTPMSPCSSCGHLLRTFNIKAEFRLLQH